MTIGLITVKNNLKEEQLIQILKKKKLHKIRMIKAKIKNLKLTSAKDSLKNMILLKILKIYRIMKAKMNKNQNQNMKKVIFLTN